MMDEHLLIKKNEAVEAGDIKHRFGVLHIPADYHVRFDAVDCGDGNAAKLHPINDERKWIPDTTLKRPAKPI